MPVDIELGAAVSCQLIGILGSEQMDDEMVKVGRLTLYLCRKSRSGQLR